MARTRSPNYPAITLGEAIEGVNNIYRADKKNKMSRETVSRHIGYGSLNGRALVKLGALKGYNLLDGAKDELRLSDLAIELVAEQKGSDKWLARAKEAAFSPSIFGELNEHYEGHRPSPENLRSELIKRGYTLDAVDKVVKIYLENYEYVGGNFDFQRREDPKKDAKGRDASIKKPQENKHERPPEREHPHTEKNEIKFSIESGKLRISALVDKNGLVKLQKILTANSDFLEG